MRSKPTFRHRAWPGCGCLLIGLAGCAGDSTARWQDRFGYDPPDLHVFRVNDFGYPTIPVVLDGDTIWLPFDTGNMVGLTLHDSWFASHSVDCDSTWVRRDSAGAPISEGCLANVGAVEILGGRWDAMPVFGFDHPSLPGLVGPEHVPGTRFTLDYRRRIIAVDSGATPSAVDGFAALPMVRSPRHPALVLVWGAVNGRPVLIELDTGKSRTTVDRELVRELAMPTDESGALVGTVEVGPWQFEVASARVVNTAGISGGLPAPIALGVGSDLLRRFVWTVDYAAGRVWVAQPGR